MKWLLSRGHLGNSTTGLTPFTVPESPIMSSETWDENIKVERQNFIIKQMVVHESGGDAETD